MKITKLIGGREAYNAAIDAAYSGSQNAAVYDRRTGWENYPPACGPRKLSPFGRPEADSDGRIWIACNWRASTGKRWAPAYAEARREILEILNDEP